jgi:hypothetical protein
MGEKTIQPFCSFHESYHDEVSAMFQYLKDEYKAKHQGREMNADEWTLYTNSPKCPKQKNTYDCGVYVCMFADFIANGWPLVFNQNHINRCRIRITIGCMQNCAVTTQACDIQLREMWGLRDQIVFCAKAYRDEFVAFSCKNQLPKSASLCFYCQDSNDRGPTKLIMRLQNLERHKEKVASRKLIREQIKKDHPEEWLEASKEKESKSIWWDKYMPVWITKKANPTQGSMGGKPQPNQMKAPPPSSLMNTTPAADNDTLSPQPDQKDDNEADAVSEVANAELASLAKDSDLKPAAVASPTKPGAQTSRYTLPMAAGKHAANALAAAARLASGLPEVEDIADLATQTDDDLLLAQLESPSPPTKEISKAAS